jgi:hypothetical protein
MFGNKTNIWLSKITENSCEFSIVRLLGEPLLEFSIEDFTALLVGKAGTSSCRDTARSPVSLVVACGAIGASAVRVLGPGFYSPCRDTAVPCPYGDIAQAAQNY